MAVKNTLMKQEFDYLLNHFGSKVTFFHTDPSHMHYNPIYDEYSGGTLQLIGDGNLQAIITTKPAEIVEMYKESGAYPFTDLNQTVIFKCSATDVKNAGLVDENFNFVYADDKRTFVVEGILNETFIRYRGEFYKCVDVRKALIYQGETSAVYFTAELDIGFKKSIYKNSMYKGDFEIEIVEPEESYSVYVDDTALSTQYREGQTVRLTVPSREGYTFDGWETYGIVEISAQNTFTMPAQDVYITSKWIKDATLYTVYLDSVVYGAYEEGAVVSLRPVEREGYVFKSFNSNDITISAQNTFTMPDKNVYVTSVYAQVFEVLVDNTSIGKYEEGTTVNIDAGTKTGYVFDSWSGNVSVHDSQSARTYFTMPSYAVSLTSNWTANFWTVTVSQSYGYNGEYTVTKGNSITIQHGSRTENYGVNGWIISSGTATGDLTQDTITIYPTSDVAIYPNWVKLGDYSVTYTGYTHAKTWHFEGDTVTVEAPAKDGYDFSQFEGTYYELGTKKYITFADYTGMSNPNTFTMPAYNVTITAKYDVWAYTVTFTVDGTTYHTQQVGFAHKVSKPTDPVKAGYDFVEWRYNGNAVNFNDEITQNRTYTAYFTAQVTYNTVTLYNSGSVYQTIQVVSGQAISTAINELPTPTHTNFERFNGWQNPLTLEYLTLNTVISADVNYTANWTTLYSVTYAGMTHATEYFAQGETVSISAPNVTGKNFTGWTSNDNISFVDSTAQNTSFTMINSNVTVTATYSDIYYSITFEVDSQTYATDTVIYGSTTSAPAVNPTKQYYTFNEWKYNNATADFTEAIYENRTYTADFTQDQYTITYMVDTDTYTTATVLGGNSIGSFPQDPTPPSGYEFNGWKYNGNTIYTSYVPSTDMTLTASFVEEVVAQEVLDIDQTVTKDICYAEYDLHWKSTNWLNYSTWQNQQVVNPLFIRNLDDGTRPNNIEHFNLPMYILSEKCCKDTSHRSTTASNRGVRNSNNEHPFDYLPIISEESLSSSDTTVTNPLATTSLIYMARHNVAVSNPANLLDACIVTYSKWHYDPNDEDLQNAPHAPILWLEDNGSGYIPHCRVCCITYNVGDSTYGRQLLCYCRAVTAIGNGWYRYEWTSDTSNGIYGSFGYDITGYFSYNSSKGDTLENLSANPPT